MGKYTNRSNSWELKESWWMLLPPTLVLAPLAFFYIAYRVKKRLWYIVSFVYFVVLIVGSEVISPMDKENGTNVAGAVLTFTLVIGITLSFIFRKEYLIRLDLLKSSNTDQKNLDSYRKKIAADLSKYGVSVHATNDVQASSHTEEVALSQVASQTDTQLEVDTPIDVNTCSEEELANLPGVSLAIAKKSIRYRQENKGFGSIDEFYIVSGLKPHFVAQIGDKLICSKIESTLADDSPQGRRLDL